MSDRHHYQRTSSSSNKWGNAVANKTTWQDEERMNDPGYLQKETRRYQEETRDSSRRALRRLNDATQIATENLQLVNSQSEQFNRMEHRLDEASSNANNVDAKVDHLKSLNKAFFLPTFGAKKAARKEEEFRRQQEEKKYGNSKEARQREKQWAARGERLARNDERIQHAGAGPRSFYSTPDGLERDEDEEEIDSNLSQISSGLSRLKMMGQAMSEELDSHGEQLRRINDRTDFTRQKVDRLNGKVDQIVDKKKPGWFSRK